MYLSEGFDDYLSKPIAGGELEKMLQKYIPDEKVIIDYRSDGLEDERERTEETEKAEMQTNEAKEKLIDRTIGLRYSADSEEIYQDFLTMFCEMTPEKIELLQQYFREEDWENYTVTVHALKSTALNVGAKVLSEKALALEKAGKANQISVILEQHSDLIQCFNKTIEESRKILL